MNPTLFLLSALAGGAGAALRLLVDGMVRNRTSGAYPWGTTLINVSGSLLLGVVVGLASVFLLSPEWRSILGVGLLGGYTTFSTASFETVRLLREGRLVAAFANGLGMLLVSLAAAALGLWVGSRFA